MPQGTIIKFINSRHLLSRIPVISNFHYLELWAFQHSGLLPLLICSVSPTLLSQTFTMSNYFLGPFSAFYGSISNLFISIIRILKEYIWKLWSNIYLFLFLHNMSVKRKCNKYSISFTTFLNLCKTKILDFFFRYLEYLLSRTFSSVPWRFEIADVDCRFKETIRSRAILRRIFRLEILFF